MASVTRKTIPRAATPIVSRAKPEPVLSLEPPKVIVDFLFDRGHLSVALINLGPEPAYRVSVAFSAPFRGVGGSLDVSNMPLFQNVEFLAPTKRIETFIDHADAYFSRKEPTRIEALVTHYDAAGKVYRHRLVHDLVIYRDLVYLVGSFTLPALSDRSANPTSA